jgi:putative ABC transport system ATP-binding protein
VLLAGEPTGSLEEGTRDEIITPPEKLSAKRGRTIVLVTHDNTIARRSPGWR